MIRPRHLLPAALAAAALLAGCSSPAPAAPASASVTVTNCEAPAEFPAPAKKVFVNDGNLISMMLAIGAQDSITAVSSLQRDAATLSRHYGAGTVEGLKQVAPEYPSLETVLAQSPDVMVAGWNYGYSETKNITPAGLRERGIAPYVLTESCRQADGQKARGIVDPWTALRDDLTNLGAITGRAEQAKTVNADIEARLAALRAAPQAATPPTIFLYDSGKDAVFSSGRFGAPEGIISAAGGRNALTDVEDTWTEVSWERVAASNPAAFVFVDYPPDTIENKIAALRNRDGVKDLPAVQQSRFLNLPYALWCSGPLNIDAAEQIRKALEGWQLVPPSTITPKFDDVLR